MTERERSETAKREEDVLAFWRNERIFEQSLEQESLAGEFVFYDGPPFATGLPHYGSLLSSIVKDVIPRYKTMRGFHVRRRWGWDCHGLPIENIVEKELGLKSKKDIETLGIEKFNEACRASVLKYADEWKMFIDRVGRWVDYDRSYKTMDATYMESVWWALKQMHKKGLLYEGRKVLLYCPHCETPLAKAEIAMDDSYRDVTEEAVTVKFKIKNPKSKNFPENSYLLAWTTTPWTIPGNVALAVSKKAAYALVRNGDAHYIVMCDLVGRTFGSDAHVVRTLTSKELMSLEYEPLYEVEKVRSSDKRAWHVTNADFVAADEGTGVVHTAVIYGEDDFKLGQEKDLPMVPLLSASGRFNADAPEMLRDVYFKDAEKIIISDVEERGLLFKKEMHTHSYPFCYRCGTPLFYNAIASWFVNIQKIKKRLTKENIRVNWFPEHLKHGRFGNTLENAPDWTISRNRYWASGLPIWKCGDCGALDVIGSVKELTSKVLASGNRYLLMRHGTSVKNGGGIVNALADPENRLTDEGRKEVRKSAMSLSGIDIIYTSPLERTRETARIVAETIGMDPASVIEDVRITELSAGEFEGKTWKEYHASFSTWSDYFTKAPRGGESLTDEKRRVGDFLYDIDSKHRGKNILIVSHGSPIKSMAIAAQGLALDRMNGYDATEVIPTASVRELSFTPLPHNRNFELDLHRPYIDAYAWNCSCGKTMRRITEVVDCWIESGSMPFAEYHYPFENKKEFKRRFPGDFIAEYIAQTRTWFYYMHAIAGALFRSHAFKNVVTTGTILAEDGSKMSKSKGNFTDPMKNLDRFGADALRYYLMTSPVMLAEDLRFSDIDLKEAHNRVVNIFWNSYRFYETYAAQYDRTTSHTDSNHPLDVWILARLNELAGKMTESFERFDTVHAGRPLRDFIEDLSQWYIRRSRDRFKGPGERDRKRALAVTRHVLIELSKLAAPIMPFIAENVYRGTLGERKSVHLETWPAPNARQTTNNERLLDDMRTVREIASKALEARAIAGVRVRQPLASLKIKDPESKIKNNSALIQLIKDEVNVKEIIFGAPIGTDVELDANITPALNDEGNVREFIRHAQDLRKERGKVQTERVDLVVYVFSDAGKTFIEQHEQMIANAGNFSRIVHGSPDGGKSIVVDGMEFTISV